MPLLSAALDRVKPSPTMAITAQAARLRREGADIVSLSAGEPDFDTPDHIKDAAIAAIRRGDTRYTSVDGTPELREAVQDKFRRENGLDYALGEVMVGTGGKQVLYNAFAATLDPGDEVIIPAPYWVSYPDMALLSGGDPVIVETTAADRFRLTPAALEQAITPRTKWLVLNSPGNPTGAVYGAGDLAALAAVLLRHPHVHVLSDDIYEHILYTPEPFATLAMVEPALKDRTLIVNGVSKGYAMTGWRIGYGAGPAPLIAAMRKVQSQSTSNPCSISQAAALAALTGPQDHIAPARQAYRIRRDRVVAALDAAPGIDCALPDGAFYAYPSLQGCLGGVSAAGQAIDDDTAFASALLAEKGVAVVPGSAFGLGGHFRVSYAAADAVLDDACARIHSFCAALG